MRVLFLNPPYLKNYLRTARCTFLPISGSNWYPIFLAYAGGWLEIHGHKIRLIDAPVSGFSHLETLRLAGQFKPELLVLYISGQSLINDFAVGKMIKKKTGCQVVLVGPWCAADPVGLMKLDQDIDAVVPREFDDVIIDLAEGKAYKQVDGLVWRSLDNIVSNPARNFLSSRQLDQFPFVTKIYKKHLPIKKYFQASLLHPFVDLFTARGCAWNQCTFCLWPHTIHKGALYRTRNLENVICELKYIKKELPEIKEVFFQDDMLLPLRARQMAELILKNKLKMNWSCYVKADVDFETLKLMKDSGCRYLHVGYETADERILKNIKKGTNPVVMKRFTEDAKKAGLRIHGDFIIGLPGETERTIKKTIVWAKNLKIEGYQFFVPQPHEATPLFAWLQKKDLLDHEGKINYSHLNYQKLSSWRFRAMREIYLDPFYVLRIIKNISSYGDLKRLARTAFYVLPNIIFPKNFP